MFKKIFTLLIATLIFFNTAVSTFGQEPKVTAEAAILMDAKTGQVLFEKNAYQKMPPASTTKIITALLAIEMGNLKDTVTISPHASQTEEAAMELKAGEKITLESLLYGALLWSSNDACVAIGEHIAGSEKAFVAMMNLRAKKLGAKNTHFANTNGLPDSNHFSSAYDLAVIARNALKNPTLAQMVNTKFKWVAGEKEQWSLDNTNRLLYSYPGADGVKTGTTNEAGFCLVSSATRSGRKEISVVLRSDDRYGDSIRLLDHGFIDYRLERIISRGNIYDTVKVVDGALEKIPVAASKDLDAVIPTDDPGAIEKKIELPISLEAPLKKGQVVGKYEVYVKGKNIASTDLVTLSETKKASVLQKIGRFFNNIF